MGKSQSQRTREHRQRKLDAGFKEIKVWVPGDLVDKLRAYAKKLCANVTK